MFNNLEIFIQLVKTGSFTQTAERLRLSKSTVSRKIIELEKYLNQRLLVRDTRNVKTTEVGEIFYQNFKDYSQRFDTLAKALNGIKTDKAVGEINIDLPIVFSQKFITPYLDDFIKQNPGIKLNLFYNYKSPRLKERDIVITSAKVEKSDKYNYRFLRSELIQLYCAPKYIAEYGIPQTIDDLKAHMYIGGIDQYDQANDTVLFTHKKTNEKVLINNLNDYSIMAKANCLTHALDMGLHGGFIFPCFNFLCEEYVEAKRLVKVLSDYHLYQADFQLVSRKRLKPQEQLFVDFIYKCMNGFTAPEVESSFLLN